MISFVYKILLKIMGVQYGKRFRLKGVPVIYNKKGASVRIGDNCTIKSSFLSNLVGLYARTIILTRIPGASIEIGDNVGISGATIYARSRISIGDHTNIGGNVKILDNDFHPVEVQARLIDDKDKIGTAPVKIGKNCFIGCNVLILKGSEIGDNCVVGAGAVVSGKFEADCMIAGNPARIIKRI